MSARRFAATALSLAAAVVTAFGALPAPAAEDPPPPPTAEELRLCEAYGPGYQPVPGTSTCIKIDGYVDMTVTYGGGSGGSPQK
jgi:hypothetical protein